MPAQDNPARPATAPASASARIAAERSEELRRRSAAVLQRADTRLRRADALLASSRRRLTRS